jgi:hypothetical protein
MGLPAHVAAARIKARQAIEMFYEHTCDITEYADVLIDGETRNVPVNAQMGIICRIQPPWGGSEPAADQTESFDRLNYDALLLIPPDVDVKPGSKISVLYEGETRSFKQSGDTARYSTHHEIQLVNVVKEA